jgi:RNA polymerase sigma factor (TIGR02999 family)
VTSTESPQPDDVAALLRRAEQADGRAADQLFALLYDELRRLAERHLRRAGAGLTLSTTTLVHETYLRCAERDGLSFPDRTRFFAYASRAMRRLVIDYARHRRARRHDRGFEITLGEDALQEGAAPDEQLEALSEALEALGKVDPALVELVDLHFFGGFALTEIAALREVSERTVQRDWRKARLMLYAWLHGSEPGPA